MRINRLTLLILAALTMCLSSCNKFKDIKVNSVDVENISPQGLRGLNVAIAAEIDNPTVSLTLSEINGAVKHSGKIIGKLAMEPFTLKPRSVEMYHLEAVALIEESVSLFDLMRLVDKTALEECTVDFSVKGTLKGGLSKTISVKDIPLKKLLEKASNEKN